MTRSILCASMLIALGAASGCGNGPPSCRSVDSGADGLTYQACDLSGFDGTDTAVWTVQAQQVFVRYDGSELTHGSVKLTLTDPMGVVVLTSVIASVDAGGAPMDGPSMQSMAPNGPWTARFDFNSATGTVMIAAH